VSRFSTNIRIERSAEEIWVVLADIGNISEWNPGVLSSHVTTEAKTGIGSGRHCDLGGKSYLDERVVEWEKGSRLTFQIIGTNLPFKNADIRFHLREDGGSTVVTVSPDYSLKFGLLGRVLDAVFIRRMYSKGMKALLKGLKKHVERTQ